MRCTVASGDVTGAANKTIVSVIAAADRRPRLKGVFIGLTGTPADAMAFFALRRFTADGTGTAGSPKPKDPGDGATPSCTAKVNYTAEPTYASGNLAEFVLHERSSMYFPCPDGADWTCAIGTANGLGIQMLSATAKAYKMTLDWDE